MPKLTLAERLQKADARKARAEQEASRLKLMQRKERTRHLIEVGGLLVKAGIDQLPPAALYDRFLRIAAEAQDPKAVAAWERAGSKHFQKEADMRVPCIARFGSEIGPELTSTLRDLGFRWNRITKQWEGKVDFAKAKETVEGMGGSVQKIGVGLN